MDYPVYGARFGSSPGRFLLFCRSSSEQASWGAVGGGSMGLDEQEAELLSWIDKNVIYPGDLTIMKCEVAVQIVSVLKRLAGLRRSGFRTIVVTCLDRVGRGSVVRHWLKSAAAAGIKVIVTDQSNGEDC